MSAFVIIVCYIKNLSQMKAIRFQAQSIMLWELSHLHCNETCLNYWSISIHTLTIDSQKMLQSERAFVWSYFISCEDIPEVSCSQKLYLWYDRVLITMHLISGDSRWKYMQELHKISTEIGCLFHEVQSQSGLYVMFDTDGGLSYLIKTAMNNQDTSMCWWWNNHWKRK